MLLSLLGLIAIPWYAMRSNGQPLAAWAAMDGNAELQRQNSLHGNSNKCSTNVANMNQEYRKSIKIGRRFRGASPACPTPRNREIGFVSSSFSFRACRACRGCVRARRGEAARACECRPLSYRWAFLVLGSTRLPSSRRRYLQRKHMGFDDFITCFDP